MSSSVAPGGSIIEIGFPGTTLMTKNTIIATPVRVIIIEKMRIKMFFKMGILRLF
jgi:hypothetical protein